MLAAVPIFPDGLVLVGLLFMAVALAMAWKRKRRAM
jgi:LPXTG-motif cell wall-anchored protein